MKLSATEQRAIVGLLTRMYHDLVVIETEYSLLAGEGDYRPRIDYFHDAVRAFTDENPQGREPGGRLSVELLSYDLSCMRYIQSMPLSPFKPHAKPLSTGTLLISAQPPGLIAKPKRPDRATRERICELYQHYAVLFAGLLKPFADKDYLERTENLNQDVQDITSLIPALEGKINPDRLADLVHHLEDDVLRAELLAFLNAQKQKKKDEIRKLVQTLKDKIAKKDKEIAAIDAAHMNFVVAQLGIYEASKEVIKKMAAQGTNIVGKFVESSLAQAKRDLGR